MIDTKPFLGAITLGVAGYGLNKIYGKNSGMNSLLDEIGIKINQI